MGETDGRPARGGRDICAVYCRTDNGLESAGLRTGGERACGALQCSHAALGFAQDEEPGEEDIDVSQAVAGGIGR